jgi:hypothetical protein
MAEGATDQIRPDNTASAVAVARVMSVKSYNRLHQKQPLNTEQNAAILLLSLQSLSH